MDALDGVTFARLDRRILALASNPRPAGCKSSRVTKTYGASGLERGGLFTRLMTAPK
jgi:hypothetical protein